MKPFHEGFETHYTANTDSIIFQMCNYLSYILDKPLLWGFRFFIATTFKKLPTFVLHLTFIIESNIFVTLCSNLCYAKGKDNI